MYTRVVMMLLSFALLAAPAQAAFVAKAAVETTTTSESALKNAVTDSWSSLSRSERKSRIKSAKEAIRNFSKADDISTNTVLLVIIAILLPPLAVLLHEGKANSRFLLSILLWLLFYIPGLIYALYIILSK